MKLLLIIYCFFNIFIFAFSVNSYILSEGQDIDDGENEISNPIQSNFGEKFRRDLNENFEENESKNSEDSFDEARIRYILDNLKARDVGSQLAAVAELASNSDNKADIPKASAAKSLEDPDTDDSDKPSELATVLSILDSMREELEMIKMSKMCNNTPDGSNCDLNGAWNSEQIGLKIELATMPVDKKLNVKLSNKEPKKTTPYKIDASWNCSGTAMHSFGGPFVFFCTKPPMDSIAVFQGTCKKCSGYETIFGQWHFQINPKDCRELWTFVESKNDILRKVVLHHPLTPHGNGTTNHKNEKTANSSNDSKKSKVRRNSRGIYNRLAKKSNHELFGMARD